MLAATVTGVDPGSHPLRPRGARRSATSASTPPRSPRPASSAQQRPGRGAGAQGDGVHAPCAKGRLLAGGILAGFFVLAFTFALLVSRSLQRQIDSFLQAARRLGSGDFTIEVPTSGHDEFAALGEEFNKMSRQLEERLEELNQERARLQDAMRRIGETFAANLDREGLLEIVVKTAVDGVGRRRRAGVRAPQRERRRSSRWR